jgi:ABC-type uncharacterized transport system substrate-binding protein
VQTLRSIVATWLLLCLAAPGFPAPQGLDILEQGKLAYKNANYQDAVAKLQRATTLIDDPKLKADTFLVLGLSYQCMGNVDQAKVQFSKAIIQNPNLNLDRDFYSPKTVELFEQAKVEGLKRLKEGMDLYKKAEWEPALQKLDVGINLLRVTSPQIDRVLIVDAYFTAAKIYQLLNKNEQAVQQFQKALTLDPELSLDPADYSSSTIALFEKARKSGSEAVQKAEALLVQNNLDSAIEILEGNRDLYLTKGTKSDANVLLAKAYYAKKEPERAADAVAAAVTVDPAVEKKTEEGGDFGKFFEEQKSKVSTSRPKILIVRGSKNQAHDLAIQGFQQSIAADVKEVTAKNIKKEVENYGPNAIFVTGADALQAVQKSVKQVPVVFTNVPRTEASKLNGNIGGIYLELPLEAQFSYLKAVLPSATRVGVVYSKEISQNLIENAKASSANYGLQLIAKNVGDPEEMKSVLRQWKDIDVFWMFLDKTAMNSMEDSQWVIDTMSKKGIPVFALHESFVREQGALFSVSSNFEALGKEAAELTQKILAKPPVGAMPTRFPSASRLAINLKTAKQLNLQISPSVISSTSLVYR